MINIESAPSNPATNDMFLPNINFSLYVDAIERVVFGLSMHIVSFSQGSVLSN